jgi:hypothetical protein
MNAKIVLLRPVSKTCGGGADRHLGAKFIPKRGVKEKNGKK